GDVPVTTDFRRVLWDILRQRMGHADAQAVFPGYAGHVPLGIVQAVGTTAVARLPRPVQPVYGSSIPAAPAPAPPARRPRAARPLPLRAVSWHLRLVRHLLSRLAA